MGDRVKDCRFNRSLLDELVSGPPMFESVPALGQLIRWRIIGVWLGGNWWDWRNWSPRFLQETAT